MLRINKLTNIYLGIRGENKARTVRIDLSDWLKEFPQASFQAVILRPDEDVPYLAQTVLNGVVLEWLVTSSDVAIAGNGEIEIRAIQDDIIKKSVTVQTIIMDCMDGTASPNPPDPYQSWLDRLIALQNDVDEKAEEAKSYSSHPPVIGDDGNWWMWNGTQYAGTDFPARGEKGERGETGDKGEEGTTFVPTVSQGGVISWTNNGGLENPPPIDLYSLIMESLTGGGQYDVFAVKK